MEHLTKLGVVMKRAKYFITCSDVIISASGWTPERLKHKLVTGAVSKNRKSLDTQLSLFGNFRTALPPLH
jgi:predicted DNA-binding helix-hairpin-helix protein